jgi:hypothetical protein
MAIQKKSLVGAASSKAKGAEDAGGKPAAKPEQPVKAAEARKLAVAKLATAKLATAKLRTLRRLG